MAAFKETSSVFYLKCENEMTVQNVALLKNDERAFKGAQTR